jgi:hypothetical protein
MFCPALRSSHAPRRVVAAADNGIVTDCCHSRQPRALIEQPDIITTVE